MRDWPAIDVVSRPAATRFDLGPPPGTTPSLVRRLARQGISVSGREQGRSRTAGRSCTSGWPPGLSCDGGVRPPRHRDLAQRVRHASGQSSALTTAVFVIPAPTRWRRRIASAQVTTGRWPRATSCEQRRISLCNLNKHLAAAPLRQGGADGRVADGGLGDLARGGSCRLIFWTAIAELTLGLPSRGWWGSQQLGCSTVAADCRQHGAELSALAKRPGKKPASGSHPAGADQLLISKAGNSPPIFQPWAGARRRTAPGAGSPPSCAWARPRAAGSRTPGPHAIPAAGCTPSFKLGG